VIIVSSAPMKQDTQVRIEVAAQLARILPHPHDPRDAANRRPTASIFRLGEARSALDLEYQHLHPVRPPR